MKKRISILTLTCVLSACGVTRSGSDLKIDNGRSVDQNTPNKISAVYNVLIKFGGSAGGCTGTAVSDDTFIFAAHCVESAGYETTPSPESMASKSEVCVSNVLLQNVCTSTTYVPKQYADGSQMKMAYDVAISVFPKGTFKTYAEVQNVSANVGDKVLLVGYSDYGLPSGASAKRWGTNVLSSKMSNITLVSTSNGSVQKVGVSPGDSGGPMFNADSCKVIGVASRMSGQGTGKSNLHTNVGWEENLKWMTSLKALAANICGVNAGAESCQTVGRFGRDPAPAADGFPCIESQGGGTNPDPTPGTPARVSAMMLAESADASVLDFYFSVDATQAASLSSTQICLVRDPATATQASDCLADPIATAFARDAAGLKIYKASSSLSLTAGTTSIGLMILDAGKVIGKGKLARR